jgi:predicted DNA binding CopG/RHH family protein
MRLPAVLLDAVRAKAKGIPYARYVRMVVEADLQNDGTKHR